MLKGLLASACLGFVLQSSVGQPLYEKTGTLSVESLIALKSIDADPRLDLPAPREAVDLYKVAYESTDMKGSPAILSGLVAIPKSGAPKGLVVYFHGTTSDRSLSPSYFPMYPNLEAKLAVLVFASGGYAVAMPDYLGLGADIGHVHPYPYSDVNSRSGIDMVRSAWEVGKTTGEPIAAKLFVSGYSEGGAVAMCAVRHLDSQPLEGFPLVKAAPMSGPYDLSGVTAKSLLDGGLNLQNLALKLYLLGFSAYSAYKNFGLLNLNQYLAPSFASYVPFVFDQHLSDEATIKKLLIKGFEMGAFHSISRVVTPEFRKGIRDGIGSSPYVAALKMNDCFDWLPTTPMLLPYLTTDTVVSPQNTLEAIQAMRAKGAGEAEVRADPIIDSKLNHITAAPYAFVEARKFFDRE